MFDSLLYMALYTPNCSIIAELMIGWSDIGRTVLCIRWTTKTTGRVPGTSGRCINRSKRSPNRQSIFISLVLTILYLTKDIADSVL